MLAWKKVYTPRQEGGLGLKEMRGIDEAMLGKHVMCILQMKDTLLNKAIQAKYKCKEEDGLFKMPRTSFRIWKGIHATWKEMQNNLWWQVGNGERIKIGSKFWFKLARAPQDVIMVKE